MSEEQQFLASLSAASTVEEATQMLVAISNLVTCSIRLCKLGEEAIEGDAPYCTKDSATSGGCLPPY